MPRCSHAGGSHADAFAWLQDWLQDWLAQAFSRQLAGVDLKDETLMEGAALAGTRNFLLE